MNGDGTTRISDFFNELASWSSVYGGATLTFFGIELDGVVEICSARVRLQFKGSMTNGVQRIGKLHIGVVPVRKLASNANELVSKLASGESVSLPGGKSLRLSATENAEVFVLPEARFHAEGLSTGRRLSVLRIIGGILPSQLVQPGIDWELKAARRPYDGLTELLLAYQLGGQLGDRRSLEVIAHTPIEIYAESRVEGEIATLGLWVPPGLRRDRARLNYRVIDRGQIVARDTVRKPTFQWEKRGEVRVGIAKVSVPRAAIVNCVAVYDDRAHHSAWIGDAKQFQNPRLQALEACNCGLDILRSFLLPSERRGAAARNFEAAVAWTLWAYGLSTAHLGNTDVSKEGPDIVAVAPNGGMAVVECTLGLLKEESKLAKVARRAVTIRDRLSTSGLQNVQVLPILITSLARREIEAELDGATEAGVLVLTRENVESALQEIVVFPDGDRVFDRAKEALNLAKEELLQKRNQGNLPGV